MFKDKNVGDLWTNINFHEVNFILKKSLSDFLHPVIL